MERPFKKEMHSPQSDSMKFVVRQKHGKTGKKIVLQQLNYKEQHGQE